MLNLDFFIMNIVQQKIRFYLIKMQKFQIIPNLENVGERMFQKISKINQDFSNKYQEIKFAGIFIFMENTKAVIDIINILAHQMISQIEQLQLKKLSKGLSLLFQTYNCFLKNILVFTLNSGHSPTQQHQDKNLLKLSEEKKDRYKEIQYDRFMIHQQLKFFQLVFQDSDFIEELNNVLKGKKNIDQIRSSNLNQLLNQVLNQIIRYSTYMKKISNNKSILLNAQQQELISYRRKYQDLQNMIKEIKEELTINIRNQLNPKINEMIINKIEIVRDEYEKVITQKIETIKNLRQKLQLLKRKLRQQRQKSYLKIRVEQLKQEKRQLHEEIQKMKINYEKLQFQNLILTSQKQQIKAKIQKVFRQKDNLIAKVKQKQLQNLKIKNQMMQQIRHLKQQYTKISKHTSTQTISDQRRNSKQITPYLLTKYQNKKQKHTSMDNNKYQQNGLKYQKEHTLYLLKQEQNKESEKNDEQQENFQMHIEPKKSSQISLQEQGNRQQNLSETSLKKKLFHNLQKNSYKNIVQQKLQKKSIRRSVSKQKRKQNISSFRVNNQTQYNIQKNNFNKQTILTFKQIQSIKNISNIDNKKVELDSIIKKNQQQKKFNKNQRLKQDRFKQKCQIMLIRQILKLQQKIYQQLFYDIVMMLLQKSQEYSLIKIKKKIVKMINHFNQNQLETKNFKQQINNQKQRKNITELAIQSTKKSQYQLFSMINENNKIRSIQTLPKINFIYLFQCLFINKQIAQNYEMLSLPKQILQKQNMKILQIKVTTNQKKYQDNQIPLQLSVGKTNDKKESISWQIWKTIQFIKKKNKKIYEKVVLLFLKPFSRYLKCKVNMNYLGFKKIMQRIERLHSYHCNICNHITSAFMNLRIYQNHF